MRTIQPSNTEIKGNKTCAECLQPYGYAGVRKSFERLTFDTSMLLNVTSMSTLLSTVWRSKVCRTVDADKYIRYLHCES